MNWLEIIEIRLASSINRNLENKLLTKLKIELSEKYYGRVSIYKHSDVENDFSIHILHHSKDDLVESPLGLNLLWNLKEFGLVNHSIWVQKLITDSQAPDAKN